MSEPAAILPPPGSQLGLSSWASDLVSLVTASVRPPPFPDTGLRGDGRTVLLIPGFLAGDWAMGRLREFLVTHDFHVEDAHIGVNLGPTKRLLQQLDETLLRLTEDGGKIAVIGHSLGGVLARYLAHKFPDRVRHVVTLCSPIRFPIVTPLQPFAHALAPLHDMEWVARRDEIGGPLAVPCTAIYSREDGIVDWHQCLQDEGPLARNVRVSGSHSTAGSNPQAQAAIAAALTAP